MRWLDSITNSMNMNLSKLWKIVQDREPWHAAIHGGHKALDTTQWLNNNTKSLLTGSQLERNVAAG